MDKEKFVKIIKLDVRDSSLSELTRILLNPPGRLPKKELKDLSVWYNSLNDNDKKNLLEVSKMVLDLGLFGFLCILDGVRLINDSGTLQLSYQNDGEKLILNDSQQEYLHDLYTYEIDNE